MFKKKPKSEFFPDVAGVIAGGFAGVLTSKILEQHSSLKGLWSSVGGGVVGLAVGEVVADMFSSRAKRQTQIQGLRHKGMAGKRRRRRTDFGSGWCGLDSRLTKSIMDLGEGAAISRAGTSRVPAVLKNTARIIRNTI